MIVEFDPRAYGAEADANISARSGSDDAPAFQEAIDAQANRPSITLHVSPGEYYLAEPVRLPNDKDIFINALGATFVTDQQMPMFERTVSNQTEALNVAVSHRVIWQGGDFYGVAGSKGLDLSATYGASIEHAHFIDCGVGLDLRFCLKPVVRNCFATNCFEAGFVARNGDWPGSALNNAQSNVAAFDSNRVYSRDGALAAFRLLGMSGAHLRDNITEGGDPENNIEYDALGGSTAKGLAIDGLHSENSPNNSVVKLKMNGGQAVIDRLFVQPSCNLIDDSDCGGYPRIEIRSIDFYDKTKHKLKHQNASGALWIFLCGEIDPSDPAAWLDEAGYGMPGAQRWFWMAAHKSGAFYLRGGGLINILDDLYFPTGKNIGRASNGKPTDVYVGNNLHVDHNVLYYGLPTGPVSPQGRLWSDGGIIMVSGG